MVVAKSKEKLILALTILFIVLVFASSMMYHAEHNVQPEKFASIPDAMWWVIVTLATVGYGDIYPVRPIGKVIGGLVVVTGIAIFALPDRHPFRRVHRGDPGKESDDLPGLRAPDRRESGPGKGERDREKSLPIQKDPAGKKTAGQLPSRYFSRLFRKSR